MKQYTSEELEAMRMTGEEVEEAISDYAGTITKLNNQESYYRGNNVTILTQPDKPAPDNKLSVSFARKAVNTVSGYMAKVGNIIISSDNEQTDKSIIETNKDNSAGIETNTELVRTLVNGRGYELHYVEDNIPKFVNIPAANIIPYYDTEMKPNIYRFIYHYTQTIKKDGADHVISYASVYYPDSIHYFIKEDIPGLSSSAIYQPHDIGIRGDNVDENLYNDLPIVEFIINQDKDNLFDHVIDLIDQHDKMMSEDIANELQRFAASYIKSSVHIDDERVDSKGQTDLDRFKDTRIIPGMQKDDIFEYLVKEINDAFITNSSDRFERLIYEMLQIPNFNDKEFGTSSGIAIAYKLIDFENLCSSIESFFSMGIERRYELISGMAGKQTGVVFEEINIQWIRNLPFDIKNLSETIEKLQAVLSEETILKMFPAYIVGNVKEEMERIKEGKEENMERMAAQMQPTEPQEEIEEDDE